MWNAAILALAGTTAAALVAAGGYVRSEYEKKHFSVERYEISPEKYRGKKTTLVFLSDLHSNCFGAGNQKLLEAIDGVKPDAILIGGDMMITDKRADHADTDVAKALVLALAERYPVYYGTGNHESRLKDHPERYGTAYGDYRNALEEAGVYFLDGKERAELGACISVAGVSLPEKYYKKRGPRQLETGFLQKELGEASKDRVQILLGHNPLFFEDYQKWGADISLSGHFHGGTIRLPFLGGVMTPQFQFFFPFCSGCFKENGRYLVVSRGLGTHSINIRFNNIPHVAVLDLQEQVPDVGKE